jgi:predicted nucleotidyltransferase
LPDDRHRTLAHTGARNSDTNHSFASAPRLQIRASGRKEHGSKVLNAADRQQIDRALALVRAVLDSDLVAAYLFGSAVLGGLQSESDLDLLVVSKRRTTRAEKQRLVHGLLAVSGRRTAHGMWRRIELTIVVERDIKPWCYPPSFDFQYGDWLRSEFESGNVEPWPTTVNPDLAMLITMVMLTNTPLFGPPPVEIFDPVPNGDLLSAMIDDLDIVRGGLDSDTRNAILTLARIWSTVATGVIRSKDAAADWVLERLPEAHRPVLARARAIYVGDQVERWDDLEDHIGPYADYVVAEIRRLGRAASEQL